MLVQPGLVPLAHARGLIGVGDLEREADLPRTEGQRDDARDPCGDPTGLILGLPVADLPGHVDLIVLAQASMSRLAVVLQEKAEMTVLSSPRLGVDYLADRLAEIQA